MLFSVIIFQIINKAKQDVMLGRQQQAIEQTFVFLAQK